MMVAVDAIQTNLCPGEVVGKIVMLDGPLGKLTVSLARFAHSELQREMNAHSRCS